VLQDSRRNHDYQLSQMVLCLGEHSIPGAFKEHTGSGNLR
jgi:hypothetical protein